MGYFVGFEELYAGRSRTCEMLVFAKEHTYPEPNLVAYEMISTILPAWVRTYVMTGSFSQ